MRNLDLLVLVSFSASLWFFNHGEIFTSVPLAYPPLVYLLGRMLWIVRARDGAREHTARRVIWPTWLLIGAAVLTLGFRVGLNLESSNVIDVGYAGVIGAHRIVEEGRSPYGNFPVREGEECGEADVSGTVRDRIQDNGRCESSNTRGDTYGPVTYLAYVPGYLALGWTGLWDSLPAAHFTSLVVDLLAIMGLVLIGWRYGPRPIGGDPRVRVGRVPVHPVRLEHQRQRHARAGLPDPRLLGRHVGSRAWSFPWARVVDEVCAPAPGATLARLPARAVSDATEESGALHRRFSSRRAPWASGCSC